MTGGQTAHSPASDAYVDVGFEHVYVHQVDPEQAECIDLYEQEVLPAFEWGSKKQEYKVCLQEMGEQIPEVPS